MILFLDLRESEVAYMDSFTFNEFIENLDLKNKKVSAAVRQLFLRNGYRAIKYDLTHYGIEEAWAVYDASCISI